MPAAHAGQMPRTTLKLMEDKANGPAVINNHSQRRRDANPETLYGRLLVGVASHIQESLNRWTGRTELAEAIRAERLMVAHLLESLADLEPPHVTSSLLRAARHASRADAPTGGPALLVLSVI